MTHPSHAIHPTALQLSMLADQALSTDEAVVITEHVESCTSCQARLAAVRDETRFIASALQIDAPGESLQGAVPKFSRPVSLRGFALANLATGLVIWLAQFLWKTLFGELIVNATTWVTSIYLPDIYAMTSATALYLFEEGTAMFDAYLGFVIVSLLAVAVLWLLVIYRKARGVTGMCLLSVVAGAMVMPMPVNALELRRDEELVTIAKSETIDDTLLVAADTVLIEGVITGDLVAVGRRIDISGTVEGNLMTFAESVTVRGKVGGLALGAASSYDLRGATVGGDLWAAGEMVGVDSDARVGRNATVAAQTTTVGGSVNKDLYTFGETVELNGIVGEDLEAFGARLRLLGEAQVAGDVRFRSASEDRLYRAETARVAGDVEFIQMEEMKKNRYATVQFYLWQIAGLIAALLVGMTFLWLVPGYRSVSVGAGIDALKTGGVGFLTLVSVPILAAIMAVTLVGLPMSFIALTGWLLGLYLAKIVVGAFVGRMLLSEDSGLLRTLFVGLAIITVAVNLPFIGGFINFVLTMIGLGLLVQYLMGNLPPRESGDLATG